MSSETKCNLPTVLIENILLYLDTKTFIKNATLSKPIFKQISVNFYEINTKSEDTNSTISKNTISLNSKDFLGRNFHPKNNRILNCFFTLTINENYYHGLYLMLRVFKGNENFGLIPLFYVNNRKFIVNMDECFYPNQKKL
jgi:hypothetical protein